MHLVPHDPNWIDVADRLMTDLAVILGPGALRLDHVGSTAVGGLPAKPKLHIDVEMSGSGTVETLCSRLRQHGYAALGFLHDPDSFHLTRPAGGQLRPTDPPMAGTSNPILGPHRICLCRPGSPSARDRRRFRDLLRADPELCRRYGELKLVLSARHGPTGNWTGYTDGKTEFIRAALAGPASTPRRDDCS